MSSTETKAVLLVGGLGTRLRSVVPSSPKALARVGDKPFLEFLIHQLRKQGVKDLVLCTGYLADQIQEAFGDGRNLGVNIEYSREPHPLGTAGAVKFAERFLFDIPVFLVLNGDSFVEVDFPALLQRHRSWNATATLAIVRVDDAARYGTVITDASDKVVEFREKSGDHAPGFINAGVYVFDSSVFRHIPNGEVSLEKDTFPSLLDKGVYAVKQSGMFIDIGTPADYLRVQQLLDGSGCEGASTRP